MDQPPFYIYTMNFFTPKIGGEDSSNFVTPKIQGRFLKTQLDIFSWLPVAFLTKGFWFSFFFFFFKFYSHQVWERVLYEKSWVGIHGSLTTVKQLAETICYSLDRQNHIAEGGWSELGCLSSSLRSSTKLLHDPRQDAELFWVAVSSSINWRGFDLTEN